MAALTRETGLKWSRIWRFWVAPSSQFEYFSQLRSHWRRDSPFIADESKFGEHFISLTSVICSRDLDEHRVVGVAAHAIK
jgi:hypothetical protein